MEEMIKLRETLDSLYENDPCDMDWKFSALRGLILENYDILPDEARLLAGKDITDCTIKQLMKSYCSAVNTIRNLYKQRRSEIFPPSVPKETLSVSETATQVVKDKAVGGVDLA